MNYKHYKKLDAANMYKYRVEKQLAVTYKHNKRTMLKNASEHKPFENRSQQPKRKG
jgi:hypothetical protein